MREQPRRSPAQKSAGVVQVRVRQHDAGRGLRRDRQGLESGSQRRLRLRHVGAGIEEPREEASLRVEHEYRCDPGNERVGERNPPAPGADPLERPCRIELLHWLPPGSCVASARRTSAVARDTESIRGVDSRVRSSSFETGSTPRTDPVRNAPLHLFSSEDFPPSLDDLDAEGAGLLDHSPAHRPGIQGKLRARSEQPAVPLEEQVRRNALGQPPAVHADDLVDPESRGKARGDHVGQRAAGLDVCDRRTGNRVAFQHACAELSVGRDLRELDQGDGVTGPPVAAAAVYCAPLTTQHPVTPGARAQITGGCHEAFDDLPFVEPAGRRLESDPGRRPPAGARHGARRRAAIPRRCAA